MKVIRYIIWYSACLRHLDCLSPLSACRRIAPNWVHWFKSTFSCPLTPLRSSHCVWRLPAERLLRTQLTGAERSCDANFVIGYSEKSGGLQRQKSLTSSDHSNIHQFIDTCSTLNAWNVHLSCRLKAWKSEVLHSRHFRQSTQSIIQNIVFAKIRQLSISSTMRFWQGKQFSAVIFNRLCYKICSTGEGRVQGCSGCVDKTMVKMVSYTTRSRCKIHYAAKLLHCAVTARREQCSAVVVEELPRRRSELISIVYS